MSTFFDLIMNHVEAKRVVNKLGWEGFMEYINDRKKVRPFDLKPFSCSTAWYDNPRYICKIKGSVGDVVIGWEGIHD